MADGKTGGGRDISRRDLFKMVVPAGSLFSRARVVLDRELCSACALCARDCPTGAIVAVGDDGLQLIFRSGLCDACGVCLEVCPEKCLRLEQDDKAGDRTVLLFQDEFARCEQCGCIIGSRAMMQRVRSKLRASDAAIASKIQLCPVCKGKSS